MLSITSDEGHVVVPLLSKNIHWRIHHTGTTRVDKAETTQNCFSRDMPFGPRAYDICKGRALVRPLRMNR